MINSHLGALLHLHERSSAAPRQMRESRRCSLTRTTYKAVGKNYAVDVVDVDSGTRLWSRRLTTPLLPASNMKIVTAVNALQAMGPDKTFTTRVVSLGKGKVAIIGGGDATLSRAGLTKPQHPRLPRSTPDRTYCRT